MSCPGSQTLHVQVDMRTPMVGRSQKQQDSSLESHRHLTQ